VLHSRVASRPYSQTLDFVLKGLSGTNTLTYFKQLQIMTVKVIKHLSVEKHFAQNAKTVETLDISRGKF
jgi:hypothetical protein